MKLSIEEYLARPDVLARFWAKVQKGDSCWTWIGSKASSGYGTFWLGAGQFAYAHRLSFAMHNGPLLDGMFVCHRCDTPSCIAPSHLFLGSPQENVDDMMSKRRHVAPTGDSNGSRTKPESRPRGVAAKRAVLNDDLVRTIRRRAANGETAYAIGQSLAINKGTVRAVVAGRTWRHVA